MGQVLVAVLLAAIIHTSAYAASLPSKQQAVLADFEAGLRSLATKSELARHYGEFYFTNRIVAKTSTLPNGEPVLEVVESNPNNPQHWFVVAVACDSFDYQRFAPANSIASAKGRMVVLRPDSCTTIFRGLFLAHELDHVLAAITGAEELPPDATLEARQLMFSAGEADAWTHQREMLDKYTADKYEQLLRAQFPHAARKLKALGSGEREKILFGWVDYNQIEKGLSLPPPASQLELSARMTTYNIDGELLRIETLFSGNGEEVSKRKILFMRHLHDKEGIFKR